MAAGSGISRLTDLTSGHQCFHPVPGASASKNVFVNKLGVHTISNKTKPHKCGPIVHPDVMTKGSMTVHVNKKSVMRIGDLLAPGGAVMAQGSHTVFAG